MEKKCQLCKKTIRYKGLWREFRFKKLLHNVNGKKHYFCSWGCMRAAEKKNPDLYAKRREL